jgi:hypothetical protein
LIEFRTGIEVVIRVFVQFMNSDSVLLSGTCSVADSSRIPSFSGSAISRVMSQYCSIEAAM